ncbi:monovalent cation/H+ antiporter subunit D [Maritimibacter dapengensis]|uniref:Monovalent cation/H+ antiporter subunit D n=1 Tax=Maritimibacter dapengensis TaxID=2836868 RepID=A0ABS6SZY4_9RHOB|nr:monovalent cation/H+ antiporter subunit D [Maritimibacter dapengensis]MBV7378419.1 monovalent cation/H+ antiporter subunit D [Maritimibacter dapengensis]
MNHWIIAPVVLPALLAPIIGYVMRHDIQLARTASVAGNLFFVGIAVGLAMLASTSADPFVYRLGDWPAPFGIVLVLDRLSALMVLLTSVLALIVLIHAIATGWDRRGRHFHALFQFQLMGISGAFLTGDIFNLFVFFEILLIASYGLMIHGGGRERMQAGLQYVVINLAGSTLFLFALGTLYASTGTLNMADLAERLTQVPVEEAGLVRVAAMLLMIVFAVKAAVFPVQFWLPGTYANAPAPVAALFAIMTKVGAYAILRVHTLIFGPGVPATHGIAEDWLFPAAIVTIAIGALGVLGTRRLMPLIAFSVIGSMGTLMLAIAAFTPQATTAALYYLIHSTFAAAALFLIGDLVLARRANERLTAQPAITENGLFAALFFGAAIAMAGMPPLSGFLGKLLVLDALRVPGEMPWAWSAILAGSLVTIVGFARAGSTLFWKSTSIIPHPSADPSVDEAVPPPPDHPRAIALAPSMTAIGLLAALAIFAGPVTNYVGQTSAQLFDRDAYVNAVLHSPLNEEPNTKIIKSHDDEGHGDEADAAEEHGEATHDEGGH